MQDRTKLILKGCGIFAGISACATAIAFVYDSLLTFEKLSRISGAELLSIFGVAMVALVLVFATVFLMCAVFALALAAIAQYIYDRIYRTPTL